MPMHRIILLLGLCLCGWLLSFPPESQAETTNSVMDEAVEVLRYPAEGQNMLLMVPSGHGLPDGLLALAEGLSQQGVEVWLADPFTTWLLPAVPSSLEDIPVQAYADLIARAKAHADEQDKALYLFAFDEGVVRLLQAARLWQQQHPQDRLGGVMLLSPDLYRQTPKAGSPARFRPIARATNLPIFLMLAERSTLTLRIGENIRALEEGGSDVYVQRLPAVRNRFFFRPDATEAEKALAARLPAMIRQAMRLLQAYAVVRAAAPLPETATGTAEKTTGKILPYRGRLQAEDFERRDLTGQLHRLHAYRGQVVLVNFWASWCPPCVHEMPSMNRLQQHFTDQPFRILAVNLGEEPAQIQAFLHRHPVGFPVLLDPDQSLARTWQVFAFPTSYLLDKQGRIRYSVAGGLDWNRTEARQIIDVLLRE